MDPVRNNLPISRLINVEAPHIGREGRGPMETMYEIVRASNASGKSNWSSVNEAMSYLTKRHLCKT